MVADGAWLHLQRTAGNSAVASSISRLRPPTAVQRTVVGPAGPLGDPAGVFELLGTAPNGEWEIAAARSLVDDHVVRNLADKAPAALKGLRSSLDERVKLAQAIVSIANNGILTRQDRERKNIRAQPSIDVETEASADKISLSQSETGPRDDAAQVAGLLEHQAMSVRMEKYVEEGGKQVPEKWLGSDSFRREEIEEAVKTELGMSMADYRREAGSSPALGKVLYQAVMKVRGRNPALTRMLAERAANSAIFGGSTGAPAPDVRKTFEAMGLDRPREGSHELRVSRSMPANALEFILLPRCLYAFNSLLRAHIKTDLTLHYVDGTHAVEVSWVPMVGMQQVKFQVESPNWKQALEEILQKESRVFAHVTRPLKEFTPPPARPPQFMTSAAMKPLTPEDLVIAGKVMGRNRAAKLSSLGMM
ncbi:hypothetical protein [Saccharothrix syringae]|uniref:Uncharacterized protein n=1 Tax=Saccharothrix syringae TaxID=103733 RepID=A0A5Q0GZ82_SACSY|nr:hypothetical protein [Saccharothrix syringae]QFZ18844.1 hypothetical protein EKG83_16550 [Saccharothrix syringae]